MEENNNTSVSSDFNYSLLVQILEDELVHRDDMGYPYVRIRLDEDQISELAVDGQLGAIYDAVTDLQGNNEVVASDYATQLDSIIQNQSNMLFFQGLIFGLLVFLCFGLGLKHFK